MSFIIIIIFFPIKQHFIWVDNVHSAKSFQVESFQLQIEITFQT